MVTSLLCGEREGKSVYIAMNTVASSFGPWYPKCIWSLSVDEKTEESVIFDVS